MRSPMRMNICTYSKELVGAWGLRLRPSAGFELPRENIVDSGSFNKVLKAQRSKRGVGMHGWRGPTSLIYASNACEFV